MTLRKSLRTPTGGAVFIKKEISTLDDQVFYIDICDKMLKNNYPDHKFFQEDGLHISPAGYKIWKETLMAYSSKLL